MSKTIKAEEALGTPAPAVEDLSEAIQESVEKAPGEEVRSVLALLALALGTSVRAEWHLRGGRMPEL